ncbi:hypothetical protein ABER99_20550 [Paenibacillus glucanolyticus]|jgi:hypothetical protein|uniref:Uncharacterized protein n=1 Tax=Paenibacillus glucanolyticus TaxID=59843 RepID=A0A168EWZ8_9BACL|nr:hypothetical protein [Paenibacillus glucanolyticus]KZS44904.1 hypothetical protein AWU65_02665 [Paenibacillus glucanolyticus]OMF65547.1 hypothetical protein BK142_30515 [Paenibacillus glucanolyticus]
MSAYKHRRSGDEILNNDKLIEQIRLCMIGDYNQKLFNDFPNGNGEIEYDVRGGQLQKNIQIRKVSLLDENVTNVVFSRKGLELLLRKTEERLKKWKPLDYATINLQLFLDENGDIVDITITVRIEQHFKRF